MNREKVKSCYILNVQAKDLWNSNHTVYENKDGYRIRLADGKINTSRFIAELSYSLDLIKLKELYRQSYRNSYFSFFRNGKQFTQVAVMVDFDYAYKDFNKASDNVYVKAGFLYRDIKDLFENCICEIDGEVVAIQINKEFEGEPCSILPEYFSVVGNKYILDSNPQTIVTKAELREKLYKEGFVCDGIKYVRYKRSSGSARVGKCLFITEKLYHAMQRFDKCGLSIKQGQEIDLAAFEAYIALPLSSCISTITLKPENFLVTDDYESVFEDTVIAVDYKGNGLTAEKKSVEIKNSIFDGQSLLDESMFENYPEYSMLLLRKNFFKSACFKCRISDWFKDNGITDVSQLNGFTLAKNIEDIKIITTPSSIKYLKFGTLEQWFENIDGIFGIVKHEKPTHYFNGEMVQCHYQLINSLELTQKDIKELSEPSLRYLSQIRANPSFLRQHINYNYDKAAEATPMKNRNEITYKLMGINEVFLKTQMYANFRDDLCKGMLREFKKGHLFIKGNYSVLLGNGVEMLQQAIGKFEGKSVIGQGCVYSRKFSFGQVLLGSRSPHINSGNILLVQNKYSELIERYFPISKEVVYINSIGENILQRLNGADFDSDSILLTDNEILIKTAKKNYNKFAVPTCLVSASKVKRYYTDEDKADLDVNTSVNKIGEIVNLSQYLNSILWSRVNDGQTIEENEELYNDICKLAVLSGIEIDKAKKEYAVNSTKEIGKLKSKYIIKEDNKTIKPYFFKMITLENGFSLSPKHEYMYFDTSMDYLQRVLNSFSFRSNRITKRENLIVPFSNIIKPMGNISGSAYRCKDYLMREIEDCKTRIDNLRIGYREKTLKEREIVNTQIDDLKFELAETIRKNKNKQARYLLLREFDGNRQCKKLLYDILFGLPDECFFDCIKQGNKNENLQKNTDLAVS